MTIYPIQTTDAPQPIGPYSQAVTVGDLLLLSGQVALDPVSGSLIGTSVGEQTRQVMKNIAAVLNAAGSDLNHIARCLVFLTDPDHFPLFNDEYEKALGGHRPARSLVFVAGLPRGALVEVECIAVR